MRIDNSTCFSESMPRRMLCWCCDQIQLPYELVEFAEFVDPHIGGTKYQMLLPHVRVEIAADNVGQLVSTTLYEVIRIKMQQMPTTTIDETRTPREALGLFLHQQETLLSKWTSSPTPK